MGFSDSTFYGGRSKGSYAVAIFLKISNFTSIESLACKLSSVVLIFSRVLRDSTPHFVGPSVGPSVTIYFFCFFAVFGLTAPAQMIW